MEVGDRGSKAGHVGLYDEFALLSARYPTAPSPTGAESFLQLAASAYNEGQHRLAELALKKAVELSPTEARLHAARGSFAYERGKLEDARASFQRALELDPNSDEAQFGFAVSLQALGRPSESVYYYLSYLETNPHNVAAMIYLAAAYQENGQPQEAIDLFEQACRIEPQNLDAHGLYGRMLFELGKIEKGADHLRRATELGSTDSEVYRALALALEARDDQAGAREQLTRALAIDPKNFNARIELSSILTDQGETDGAVEHAQAAVDVAKSDGGPHDVAVALWQLGWAYYKAGDWRESSRASQEALAVEPSLTSVRFNLGLALLRNGDVEQAREAYETAAHSVEDAWDLRVDGIDDLRAALEAETELLGGAEILELLEKRYRELSSRRSGAVPS